MVKQDAFVPHPYIELSMTRHEQMSEEELWTDCRRIAGLRQKTLYGRADVGVAEFEDQSLVVVADPIAENPNHAIATGWPVDKPAQKMKALQIALKARFIPAQI